MKQFKRITSLVLLLAMFFGLVNGVVFQTTSAAEEDSNVVVDENGNPVVNLLKGEINYDFEEVPAIPGWSMMDGVAQSETHLYDDGGIWALLLADSSSSAAVWSISDKNKISAGESYEISAQVYGGIGSMTVYFYDASGNELSDLTIELATAEASESWQKLSANFVADANAASLAVKLSTTEAGKDYVWFDAVILRSTASDGFALNLNNGDFSQGFQTNGKPVGWGYNANTKSLSLTDWDNNGDQELAIDTTMVTNAWLFTDNFPILAGYPYTASIDIYQTVAAKGQFYIQFYSGADANSTQLASKGVNIDGTGLTDGWVTLSVNNLAPAGAQTARIVYISTGRAVLLMWITQRFPLQMNW